MEAHVINLKERTDRWEAFKNNWKDAPFELIREDAIKYDGLKIRNIYDAVFLKHRELLQKAKDEGEKHLFIMEDDAVPLPKYKERWEQIRQYLETRDDWDIFNGGMLSIRQSITKVVRLSEPTTLVLAVNRGCMAHFLYFNVETALEKLKDWEKDEKPEFDAYYAWKLKTLACVPYIASQSDGVSDATNSLREWEDRFKYEQEMMMYSLREFITSD